jgi:hypothetical protein
VRRALALLAAATILASCGGDDGGGDATPVLRETADKLGEIRSGDITFTMEVDPRGEAEPFGFTFTGPFALGEAGELPRVDVEYTQRANGEEATVRLVSDGERAVTLIGGQEIELDESAVEDLRQAGAQVLGEDAADDEGLEELRVDRWLVEPELSEGPDGTDRIEGELDVVEVANGLIELAGSLTGTQRLDEESAKQLRDAVESSEFELLTGEDDRLLRRLSLAAVIAADVPEELREALGDVVGGEFSFLLELDRPNEPVEISLP